MKARRKKITLSLSSITVLSVTAAAVIAVSVCIGIFASVYSKALLRDARVSTEQTADQTALFINNYLSGMKEKLNLINGIVSDTKTPEELSGRISALTYIQNDIYAVTVYGKNGEIVSCTGSGAALKGSIYKDASFDKELFETSGGYILFAPHVQTLFENEYPWVVTLAVKTDEPVFENGAYIAIDFNFSEIAKYISSIGVGRHGTKSEKDKIYTVKTSDGGNWRIVSVAYTGELAAERRTQIIISVAITVLSCAAVLLIVLAVYSKIVNAPVKALIREIKQFERNANGFTFSGGDETVKELRVISSTFGHMTGRIKQLMEQVRREETELRKTELKALQAQINPHFLYNTLDSIQWMCERGKTEDAAKMVSALARLFRISISKGRELIPIKDELRHAENYLLIQSYRYKDQFTYSFDVDESLCGYLCNKITVQPLIENAIYHGLDRLVDEGEIKITVKQAPDDRNDILITVSDNGVGMTKEQCEAILKKERSDSSGIGVKNVNDRLKIYFGDKYGLTIESELDVGTSVTVRIPKQEVPKQ